jgi:hypothetical protein
MYLFTLLFCIYFVSIFGSYANDKKINYVYINANSGQSSGGHSGLKIGSYLYHFQFYDDRIFHLVREKWSEFLYVYNSLDNRKIFLTEIKVSNEEFEKISSFWNQFYLIQTKQLEVKDNLQRDTLFLQAKYGKKKINIPSLSYLDTSLPNTKKNFLNKFNIDKIKDLQKKIESERYKIEYKKYAYNDLKKDLFPISKSFYSQKIIDNIQKSHALMCLEIDCQIKKESYFLLDSFISPDEKKILLSKWKLLLPILEKRIENYLSENNSFSEKAFLITVIRFKYIQYSIQTNSIHLPDSYSRFVSTYSYRLEDKEVLNELKIQMNFVFSTYLKKYNNSKSLSEEDLLELEDSGNRLNDLFSNSTSTKILRSHEFALFPSKEEEVLLDDFSFFSRELESHVKESEKLYFDYEKNLQFLYPFDLISENCTTEIFTTLNRQYSFDSEKIKLILGGKIEGRENLDFIPFVANYNVGKVYRTGDQKVIESFRIRNIRKMKETENPLWVEVRESNTLLSKTYKSNTNDSFFIFFTDDVYMLRPLYGTFNLMAGISQFGVGLFTLPFDRGRLIKMGGYGVLFSLPELVFFNIRKGTFVNSEEYKELFFGENSHE